MEVILAALAVVLLLIIIMNCSNSDKFANSPYTVPYMKEKISPMATFKCIYPTIPLVRFKTYTQT
jgi:hypothetical protein